MVATPPVSAGVRSAIADSRPGSGESAMKATSLRWAAMVPAGVSA
ncbi:hypothetical protein [Streptomyces sp. NPDC088726]